MPITEDDPFTAARVLSEGPATADGNIITDNHLVTENAADIENSMASAQESHSLSRICLQTSTPTILYAIHGPPLLKVMTAIQGQDWNALDGGWMRARSQRRPGSNVHAEPIKYIRRTVAVPVAAPGVRWMVFTREDESVDLRLDFWTCFGHQDRSEWHHSPTHHITREELSGDQNQEILRAAMVEVATGCLGRSEEASNSPEWEIMGEDDEALADPAVSEKLYDCLTTDSVSYVEECTPSSEWLPHPTVLYALATGKTKVDVLNKLSTYNLTLLWNED